MRESLCGNWGKCVLTTSVFRNIALAVWLGGTIHLPAMPNVWINEIHYDNSGTDAGEGIEIAGVAGTAVDGFKLELYNGGNGAVYNSINLTGTIPDQQNGFGTLFFAISGIQNGSPDGVALADASMGLIQFLSYEGVILATDGTADGISSTELPVSESTAPEAGFSLQLTGSGSAYSDFTWAGPLLASYDSVNTGQQFVSTDPPPPPPPDNSVPDTGSTLAFFGLTFLGLLYRSSHRQGGAGLPDKSTLG